MGFSLRSKNKAKELGEEMAPEVIAIGLGEGASAIEEATGFPVTLLLEAGLTIKDIRDASEKGSQIPNPHLLLHGLGDGPSPATAHYQKIRRIKKIGGALYSFTGTGLQAGLDVAGFGMGGVDAFGLAKHGASEASTLGHLTRLGLLAKTVRQSQYLESLVLDMIKVKAAKAGVRGGRIAAAAIPNSIASNVVSITISLGAAGLQTLLKELVNRVACEVHWRAYQELVIGRIAGGGYGPACRMAQELMNHTFSSSFVPTENARAFLREPAGYLVIKDKLAML